MTKIEIIFVILFWITWITSVVVLNEWQRSTAWWKQYVEDLLDDWEKSSTSFLEEYDTLNEKYQNLLKETKAIEDDFK